MPLGFTLIMQQMGFPNMANGSALAQPPQAATGSDFGWVAEKTAFDLLGYSAPMPLAEPARAEVASAEHDGERPYVGNPHTTSAAVRSLFADPGLVAQVRALCGPNLKLWRSVFFLKKPGAAEIGWHHDKHFYRGEENDVRFDEIGTHFSVLFALTEIAQTAGMIQVVPGTHADTALLPRDPRPVHLRPKEEHILNNLPQPVLDNVRSVPIPAGSFLVFHSALLHRPRRNILPSWRLRLVPAQLPMDRSAMAAQAARNLCHRQAHLDHARRGIALRA